MSITKELLLIQEYVDDIRKITTRSNVRDKKKR